MPAKAKIQDLPWLFGNEDMLEIADKADWALIPMWEAGITSKKNSFIQFELAGYPDHIDCLPCPHCGMEKPYVMNDKNRGSKGAFKSLKQKLSVLQNGSQN